MNERTQEMARAYTEEGLSYAQIGERYSISRQRVGQILGPLRLAPAPSRLSKVAREQRLRAAHVRLQAGEVTLEGLAEEFGYSSGETMGAIFRELGLSAASPRSEPAHGTRYRYQSRKWACRCDECRAANAEHSREKRGQPAPSHGVSGYTNYGCRCQVCTEANRMRQRLQRAAKRRGKRKEVKA